MVAETSEASKDQQSESATGRTVKHCIGCSYRKSVLEDHLEEGFTVEEVPVCFQSVKE